MILCVVLPVVLVLWLGSNFSPRRAPQAAANARTRIFVLILDDKG